MRRTILSMLACLMVLAGNLALAANVTRPDALAELQRIENLRLLHRFTVQEIHDAKTLALYLRDWGGADRSDEVETMMQEAEDLYGVLRGVDKGGQSLLAQADAAALENPAVPAPDGKQLALLQRGRREAASRVNDFYARALVLRQELAEQVKTAAAEKIQWRVISQPEPWQDANRDSGRRQGIRHGILLEDRWFFSAPENEQDVFLQKAQKIGSTHADVLWTPACNWGDIEKQAGQYDFSKVDQIVDRLAKYDLDTCLMLRTFTGTPPQWLIDQYGTDCQFTVTVTDRRGNVSKQNSGVNLFHQPTGEAFAKFLTAYADHAERNWPERVAALYLNGGQHELQAVADESPAMQQYWQQWSKTDTQWRTPEAIYAAEGTDSEAARAVAIRAEQCREQWLLDYVARVRSALKQGWPQAPVQQKTSSEDFHQLYREEYGKSRDLFKLAELADNPAIGTSSAACYRLLESFSGDKWLWSFNIHTGCGTTGGADYSQAPLEGAVSVTGGRMGRVSRSQYPSNWYRYSDGMLGDFGIGAYFVAPRRTQEYGSIVLNTSRPQAEIGIFYSQASRRFDPKSAHYKSLIAWGHLLQRDFYNYDYVPEYNLAERMKNYKVLILPNTQLISVETAGVIREWVRQGGILLGFGAPGILDELGGRRETLPLADVFGADVARMRVPGVIYPDKLETTHSEGPFIKLPPHEYKFETDLTAALRENGGEARAWFAGEAKDIAIVENTFGQGKTMLCGMPLGFEYWESSPYELAYGMTYFRQPNYNMEQKRYEQWVVRELNKLGIRRQLELPYGDFLRGQCGDDPDWSHVYRNNPEYAEYFMEPERPVRTIFGFVREREGINNMYVGLVHPEGNYSTGRGYFRFTLTGAELTTSVALDGGRDRVVFDTRLGVPVPVQNRGGSVWFKTWLPITQSAMFAASPDGTIRLFGENKVTGIDPESVAKLTAAYESGTRLANVEMLDRPAIEAFLADRTGKSIVIGCGDTRFRPSAKELADWLQARYQANVRITTVAPRGSCRRPYMDGWGYPQYTDDPVYADILIGNCQDNGLMWKFAARKRETAWLPLEINQNFPGPGKSIVMLSSLQLTDPSGQIVEKTLPRQLIIGASYPSEALQGVQALEVLK